MIHRCLSSHLPSQEQEHWASWVLLNLLLSRFGHISLVQRNLTKAYSGLFRGTKKHFKGHHYTFVFVPRGIFFFWRKSITNLGGQATQSASWISLYFVSTLHMTMKGCDILTGSRLHQAVHNELENNKIQMLSQVNTSLLSKVNQIRRILLQVFFFASIIILCEGIFLFAGTSVFFQHSKTSGALFLHLWYWKPNSQENISLTWMTLICL